MKEIENKVILTKEANIKRIKQQFPVQLNQVLISVLDPNRIYKLRYLKMFLRKKQKEILQTKRPNKKINSTKSIKPKERFFST